MTYSILLLMAGLAWTTVLAAPTLVSRTAGCGQPHTVGALKHFSMWSGGVIREVAVYIPLNVSLNSPAPLILSFHGNNKTMDYQAKLSRFTEPAINNNSIAVFPNGLSAGQPPENCWEGAPYCNTGVSDKVFVTDLLKHMRDNYCVDNNKIYASGKSIGGGFVDVLACSPGHGGDFAAFAMDAAQIYTEADGSSYNTAKYGGGFSHGAATPNIRQVLGTWATRNGCSSSPVPVVDELRSNKVYYTQYDCAGRTSVVVGYNVTSQGHVWISTEPNDDNKGNTAPIDASTIMMSFFQANPKP